MKDEKVSVRIDLQVEGEPDPRVLSAESVVPPRTGYPFPGWKEHRVLVLREDFGLDRRNEPRILFISAEADKVADWARELRAARFDPDTDRVREIPCQVLSRKRWVDSASPPSEFTTCEAAFLADVPARSKAYYIFFFGNPTAVTPEYSTDLAVRRDDNGTVRIENAYYRVSLHSRSGQIDGFYSKTFGVGKKRGFYSKKYPLHYNPDVWVRGRPWSHVSDWNPPPHSVLVEGPVAVVSRRWGKMPWVPEMSCQVTYRFFSNTPYILVESTMDVHEDLVVNALRNEEVVINPDTEIDHVGWRRPTGQVVYKPAELEPGLSRGMLGIIEADAPYVCLVREAEKLGVAGIRLNQFAGSHGGDSPVLSSPMTILADYGWNFRYWSRSLVYPWGDKLPDLPAVLNAGTFYSEKSAYCLFPLEDGEDPRHRLQYLESLSEQLTRPLREDKQGTGPW